MRKYQCRILYLLKSQSYTFESIGPKGKIDKIIIFEEFDKNIYNVALCDFIDGKFVDDITINNQDTIKLLSTVAKTIYDFLDKNPTAKIEISSKGKKRLRI